MTVSFDPTAAKAANQIHQESHSLTTSVAIFPTEGQFYIKDLLVEGQRPDNSWEVVNGTDGYFLSPLDMEMVQVVGKEVYTYLVIMKTYDAVRITYRATGGRPDSTLLAEIQARGTFNRRAHTEWTIFRGQEGIVKPYARNPELRGLSAMEVLNSQLGDIVTELRESRANDGTTTQKGIVRLATPTEAVTGVESDAVVTPEGLKVATDRFETTAGQVIAQQTLIQKNVTDITALVNEITQLKQSVQIQHNAATISDRNSLLTQGVVNEGESVFVADIGDGTWAIYRLVDNNWVVTSARDANNFLTIRNSNESQPGIIKCSTDAEATARTSVNTALTPKSIQAMVAAPGILGLAQAAERADLISGAPNENHKFVTPEQLALHTASTTQHGLVQFGQGINTSLTQTSPTDTERGLSAASVKAMVLENKGGPMGHRSVRREWGWLGTQTSTMPLISSFHPNLDKWAMDGLGGVGPYEIELTAIMISPKTTSLLPTIGFFPIVTGRVPIGTALGPLVSGYYENYFNIISGTEGPQMHSSGFNHQRASMTNPDSGFNISTQTGYHRPPGPFTSATYYQWIIKFKGILNVTATGAAKYAPLFMRAPAASYGIVYTATKLHDDVEYISQ